MSTQGAAKKWLLWLVLAFVAVLLILPLINSQLVVLPPYRHEIQDLEAGLEAFKWEFGIYPPSDNTHDKGAMPYGRSALIYYLMGPHYTGWGSKYNNTGPFGGTITKAIPPYFTPDHPGDVNAVDMPDGTTLPVLCDTFSPDKPILYFRAEPGRDPLFDVRDNPTDPTGATGFVDQAHFEMLVRPDGKKWVREDYLLISPGADRLYGPVVLDKTTGQLRPARPGEKDATCDDVTNFAH